MTFTTTFDIGYYPGSPRELFIEDAPLTVEFDADVRIERDDSVGWAGCECEPGSVDIESAMLEVECEQCLGGRVSPGWNVRWAGISCKTCKGTGRQQSNILSILSATDLARLKEECAEWAMEHAVEENENER